MDGSDSSLRQMVIDRSCLSNADGSARVTQGLTSALVSVNGPDQVSSQKELIDKTYVEVHYQSKKGMQCCKDKEMESILAEICQETILTNLHPRTSLLLKVQELHNDGCLLSCTINAMILALLDANVPLKYLTAAATCCVTEDGVIHLDPTKELLESSASNMTLVVENQNYDILAIKTHKLLDACLVDQCITLLTQACKTTIKMFIDTLSNQL